MPPPIYIFGDFELNPARFELRRNGRTLKLERMPLELLILLVEHDGQVVRRQVIVERLWGKDVFVDAEHGVNTAIRKIRTALREDAERPRFIQTISGKGYRFVPDPKTDEVARISPDQEINEPVQRSEVAGASEKHSWRVPLTFIAALLVVGAVGFALNIEGRRDRAFAAHNVGSIHSIAVLPLVNLSADASQDYYADGMTDELITALAQNRSLRVVSRTSAMQYKGVNRPLRDIAQALGVDGILEGSVNRSTNRVHVNLQLIYAPTDTHVWAQSYDRDLDAAMSLPEEVSYTIAAQSKTPRPIVKAERYVRPEAHDAYLQGRFFWFMGDLKRSQQYFERAAQVQPDYAAAWDGLADTYSLSGVGWRELPSEAFPKAEEYVRKALALDDSLPEVHNTLAADCLFYNWDWQKAEVESRRSIELNPNFAEAHYLLSYILFVQNRDAEALQERKISTEIDPLTRPESMGEAYISVRQFDAAIEDLNQRAQYRRDFWVEFDLSEAYQLKGEDREAAGALAQAYLNLNDGKSAAAIRASFQKEGLRGVRQWMVRQQLAEAGKGYVSPWVLAWQYAQLKDKEQTLIKLGDAYKERSPLLILVQKEPVFDFLHSDMRYRALIAKIGLPPAY